MSRCFRTLLLATLSLLTIACSTTVATQDGDGVKKDDNTTGLSALATTSDTVMILLRHAEKGTSPAMDPNLSEAGQARASELARLLASFPLEGIYSTPYNRTRQTVTPLASAHGLEITTYDANKPASDFEKLLASRREKMIVIVGHSNTVPQLVKQLSGGVEVPEIAESEFDNLFVVRRNGGPAKVERYEYGVATQ